MKRSLLYSSATLLLLLLLSGHPTHVATAGEDEALRVAGLWSGTVF